MPIDVKHVQGRRQLTFHSFDDILADAESLVASPTTRTLGNWPLPQLFMHLANAMNRSIDGISFKAPWYIRLLGPFIKRHILKRGMSPGFKLPRDAEASSFPAAAANPAAIEALRHAISRVQSEQMTSPHPVFGRLTHDEWRQLHLHHAALHLSFARLD